MLSQQRQHYSIAYENTKVKYCWATTIRNNAYILLYEVRVPVRQS